MSKAFLALPIPKVVPSVSIPWMLAEDGDIIFPALAVLTFVILTVDGGKGGGTFRCGSLFIN